MTSVKDEDQSKKFFESAKLTCAVNEIFSLREENRLLKSLLNGEGRNIFLTSKGEEEIKGESHVDAVGVPLIMVGGILRSRTNVAQLHLTFFPENEEEEEEPQNITFLFDVRVDTPESCARKLLEEAPLTLGMIPDINGILSRMIRSKVEYLKKEKERKGQTLISSTSRVETTSNYSPTSERSQIRIGEFRLKLKEILKCQEKEEQTLRERHKREAKEMKLKHSHTTKQAVIELRNAEQQWLTKVWSPIRRRRASTT